jgi:hypothetical protein
MQVPGTNVQGDTQVVPQAPLSVVRMSWPLDLEGAAAMAGVEQLDTNGAMRPPESITPPDAALSVLPGPASTAEAKASTRSRLRLAGLVVSVLVAAIGVGTVSLFKEETRPGPGEAKTSAPAPSMARPIAQPSPVLEPVRPSTQQPAARVDAFPVASTEEARSERQAPRAAAANPTQSKPASPKESRKPVAAKEQGPPPSAAKTQTRGASPRQACAGKQRYALLQCMETQCAKKAWTQHEQCVRLRKERKL